MICLPRRPEGITAYSLPPGLRGYWSLDDGVSAQAADWSGYANNGTKVSVTAAPGQDGRPAAVFNGSTSYITLGFPPKEIGLKQYTLTCWFIRTGAGVGTSTGTGGIALLIPLISHGRAEADGSNLDMNWCFGINDTGDILACDFEDTATGANHPVNGVTAIVNDIWYHGAVTFDGFNHQVWLNGRLDGTIQTVTIPRWDSIQHAGFGSAMTSAGTAAGFFAGRIQDVQVYNRALSVIEINKVMQRGIPRLRPSGIRRNSMNSFGLGLGEMIGG